MAHATLGYPNGPAVAFRVDPEQILWNWQVLTNVVETIGGRVIQVIGAYLDDMTISGSLGDDHRHRDGESWEQAGEFVDLITKIMEHQSRDAAQEGKMHVPAIFTYPPLNYRFEVYVKALTDPDGNASVILRPGKFNQRYNLTLFIVQPGYSGLVKAGTTGGVYSQKAYDAIAAFMSRVSDGIGWHFTQYNGQTIGAGTGPAAAAGTAATGPHSGRSGPH